MLEELQEVWRFRYLLRQFVARELKIRYKNSVFGVLWSIVPPIVQVIVFKFFFTGVTGREIPNYSAYVLCGLIPWTFFTTACLDSCQSLLNNYGIMKKVYLPREIIPLSYVISNSIHFVVGWIFYFIVFYLATPILHHFIAPRQHFDAIPILPTIGWFPLLLLMEFGLVIGCSFWLAALNLYYQDIKYLLQTLFGPLLFLMPVLSPAGNFFYSLQKYGLDWFYPIYMLNPITAIITGFRDCLLLPMKPEDLNPSLKGAPLIVTPTWVYLGALSITLVILWSGYAFFNYRKWQFVERY